MHLDDAAWALAELERRRPGYALARAYFDGRHRLRFATEQFRSAFGDLFREFCDNACEQVVSAPAERLRITGWSDQRGGDATRAGTLWGMDMLGPLAGQVHQEALALGDAYLIVWPLPEGGSPGWYPQVAEEMVARYDPDKPRRIAYAAKVWLERHPAGAPRRARLTMYYPDRVERYATVDAPAGVIPVDPTVYHPLPESEGQGPPVVKNPYQQVPVFHFANGAGIGRPGRPEHWRAIPLQDAMNKTLLDLLVGGEYQALPQRWGTGVEEPTDENGQPKPLRQGPGTAWLVPEPEARMGAFPAANLLQLLEVADGWALRIARSTNTPAHRMVLAGDRFPSGEALERAEAPLVAKCQNRIEAWSPVWGHAMTLGLTIAGAGQDALLRPTWADPSGATELRRLEALEAKARLGWSRAALMREHGLTDEEVERVLSEAEDERARDLDGGAL